eukprot:scaffold12034_cov155-Isochrysis_galbana.AAC.2
MHAWSASACTCTAARGERCAACCRRATAAVRHTSPSHTTHTNTHGKKDYSRSPPPTSYEPQSASSPYPSTAPTPSRSVYPRQTGRTCTYPSNGQGLPADAGATEWNQELWKRARARFYPIARYAAHPVVSKALAFCRPCDASMTKPRTEELGAGISVWTNENGCAYCAFRPRAPPNTPADEAWKYGTGDGAHNPVTCPPYIRYLCEAGAGEFSIDDGVKALLRSLVGLKQEA